MNFVWVQKKSLLGVTILLVTGCILFWPSDDVTVDKGNSKFQGTIEPNIRLVTATSENHFKEALRACLSVAARPEANLWKFGFMITYDLGVTPAQKDQYLRACPFVEWRTFNFTAYPPYVRSLKQYRWKFLLVNEVFQEVKQIVYFDSSVVVSPDPNYTFEKIFEEMKTNYSTCGFRLFDQTGHSMFSATHPSMFNYYNFSVNEAKITEMGAATLFSIVKNEASIDIMESLVKCSFVENCMAPQGHNVDCNAENLESGDYAKCHRYDQSALTILLVQCSRNQHNYVGPFPLFSVQRMET